MGGVAVIDTNFFVYALFEDYERHEEALDILMSLDKWVVPTITLYELIWQLAKMGVLPNTAEEMVKQIIEEPRAEIVDDRLYLLSAFELFGNLGLKHYNDSVILAIAKETGTLASYDKKLRNRAGKVGIKLLPEVFE
ncbi:MAG: PIN domain-containing protein [Thermococcus sp.]|uniref:Nucleotide-binding protein n=1 Tax=Thermococcus guaymasensis DSM 11113 TaxID=1432656 RepID=A0A0X1KKC0_9EURY|nr:PIN domain-containing protein [Thermococcus guaymasensis]AJC71704.1 nucleotide-binding protein [Thermococcus guaymasensis DSM 11113]MCD6525252.1 PIN domain-containing protein [Thermococcus sp.]